MRVEHLVAQIELYSKQIAAAEAQVDALTCDLKIREQPFFPPTFPR